MTEVGILFRINHHWNGIKLTGKSNGHFESVRIDYLAPIFIFLLVSYVLAVLILLYEICKYRYEEAKKRKLGASKAILFGVGDK